MRENKNILLAEDDENLGKLLISYLQAKGFHVELAKNGKIAYELFNNTKQKFDLLVLDVMMPEMDGLTLGSEIRLLDKNIPFLFLSAKSMKEDKLRGFGVGADDYITKPFSMEELLARINAILKRTASNEKNIQEKIHVGRIQYEPELSVLHLNEGPKKLTTKENMLLKLLVQNQNDLLDRQAALRAVWGDDNYFNGRSMDVYIAKLRKLLKEDENIEIMNVHGIGFKLLVKQ
ncbi:MAG: response regulator transcription factor [Crocinitomicaceae bacterium]|nr:response regulator transcription factor [Crocinitomicaceae bacterium]